jgi:hypothetical protein
MQLRAPEDLAAAGAVGAYTLVALLRWVLEIGHLRLIVPSPNSPKTNRRTHGVDCCSPTGTTRCTP